MTDPQRLESERAFADRLNRIASAGLRAEDFENALQAVVISPAPAVCGVCLEDEQSCECASQAIAGDHDAN